MNTGTRFFTCCILVLLFGTSGRVILAQTPWSLNNAWKAKPDWLSLSGHQRTSLETLNGQFRKSANGSDQALLFRTALVGEINYRNITFVTELMDSRAQLADAATPLNNSIVNALDVLQAYAEFKFSAAAESASSSTLQLGRFTMDAGSRRLLARNRYRNTINAFSGLDYRWQRPHGNKLQLFYTFPVERFFAGPAIDNKPDVDKAFSSRRFWGVRYETRRLLSFGQAEMFLFGLDEEDSAALQTGNRDLISAGIRFWQSARLQHPDYEFEGVFQTGSLRNSSAITDIQTLEHQAFFVHLETGYSFAGSMSPRLSVQLDYASGDNQAGDLESNNFDTLFGARRFDFGHTNLYGAFARSNLVTPGIRLTLNPARQFRLMLSLRDFRRASAAGPWSSAGFSPANSVFTNERHLGTQFESSLQWDVVPGNLGLETGFAYLSPGEFMKRQLKGDSTFFYLGTVISF